MDLDQALALIDSVLARVTATRADHESLGEAMRVVVAACGRDVIDVQEESSP